MSKSILSWGTLVASIPRLPDGEMDRAAVMAKAAEDFKHWESLNQNDLSKVGEVIDSVIESCGGGSVRVNAQSLRRAALSRLGVTDEVSLKDPGLATATMKRVNEVLSTVRYRSFQGKHGGIQRRTDEEIAYFVANGKDREPEKDEKK